MSKTAIVILSDPKSDLDESLGRALNGLAAAYDFKTAGEDIKILFSGAGTRWPKEFQKEDHIAHKINRRSICCLFSDFWGRTFWIGFN